MLADHDWLENVHGRFRIHILLIMSRNRTGTGLERLMYRCPPPGQSILNDVLYLIFDRTEG